jgi:hypothetical protein
MPFRVPGLDLMDLASPFSPGPEFARASLQEGTEMLKLMDRSTLTALSSPADRERESLEATPSYISSSGATVMTSEKLADAGSSATPPAPRLDRFGDRVSHIADRFVLSGSREAYRVWRFQSAEPAMEFPVTKDGWAHAWTTFRELEGQSPALRPPQARTGQRRGELKQSMYRDEPLMASSIAILESVPGFGLDEAAAFEVGKRFMRLPRPPAAPPPWVAPLDDVDS